MAEYTLASGLILPGSAIDGKAFTGAADLGDGLVHSSGVLSRFRDDASYLQAIKIPWVYACVSLIAYTFATNPIRIRNTITDTVIEDPTNPFLQLMHRPNPHQSGFFYRELYATYAELCGTVYQTLESMDANGIPREMYLPNPAFVTPVIDPNTGWPSGYAYDSKGLGRLVAGPGVVVYSPHEIIVSQYANPLSQNRGLGVVEAGETLLNTITEMETHELSYWNSGGRITGVLQTDRAVSDASFARIQRRWQAANADRQQRVRTAILEAGLNYKPIAEGLAGLDLVNIAKAKRDQILGMFGVPLPKLGIMENAQYKQDDADRTFQGETMAAKYARHEDAMQGLVDRYNPDWSLEHERVNFEDDADKLDNAIKMQQLNFSQDEIRAYLGVDPAPKGTGDVVFVSSAVIPSRAEDMGDAADNNAAASALAAQPTPAPQPAQAAPPGTPARDMVQLSDHLAKSASVRRENKRWRQPQGLELVAIKSARLPSPKPPTRVSNEAPVLSAAMISFKNRTVNSALEHGVPALREAFGVQRKPFSPRGVLPTILKLAGSSPEAIRAAVDAAWRPQPLADAIRQIHAAGASAGYEAAKRMTGRKALEALIDTKAPVSPTPPTAVAGRLDEMGARITAIDGTTREAVVRTIQEGMNRGYTPLQVANGYPGEGYLGISDVFAAADEVRAETIARTEMMRAFNAAAFVGYRDSGVLTVQAMDGTVDPVCAERNGDIVDLSSAESTYDHPNGTLTWIPISYSPVDLSGVIAADEGSPQ